MLRDVDVLVVGGGNAGLCAAIAARTAGARVLVLESAPQDFRGGNSRHTRNLRCMHEAPADGLTDAYPESEYWDDLARVTGGRTDEALARIVIRQTATCRDWMVRHGARFQPSLGGTLHLSRTNAFFLGGGKALMNGYYRAAETPRRRGRIQRPGDRAQRLRRALHLRPRRAAGRDRGGARQDARRRGRRIPGESRVAARDLGRGRRQLPDPRHALRRWPHLAPADGRAAPEPPAIPSQCHAVAIDARAPRFDGGIITRVDCVSLGIAVNTQARRFYDEGEDFWPKRYAIWGRLVAQQANQLAFTIIDAKSVGGFVPPFYPPIAAGSIRELAVALELDPDALDQTVRSFNAAVRTGTFNHAVLDDCSTDGIHPPKSHWARRLDTPPFLAYPLRPGITFTYLGVAVNERAQIVLQDDTRFENVFAAGEIMSGNILGQGYLAGLGMAIGTVFGRIAGEEAARYARG